MNRYPAWKFAIIVIALLLGVVYTLPNFFGEAPAVQVSSSKMSAKVDTAAMARVEDALKAANVMPSAVALEGNSIKARFETTEQQLKAKDAIQKALIPEGSDNGYVVALNLLSRSPEWLTALHAAPMYLGLDLRGGVHFMLQVDMKAALSQKIDSLAADIRTALREKMFDTAALHAMAATLKCAFVIKRNWPRPNACWQINLLTSKLSSPQRAQSSKSQQASNLRQRAVFKSKPSNKTSPRCTIASTNWAWLNLSSSNKV